MNEQLLIQKILQGDTESFRYLYRQYARSALQLAMSVCKQRENSEEVVQNSFINAFHYLKNFRQDSSFKTWILRIVFNEAIRFQKAERKFQWEEMEQDEKGEVSISIPIPNTIEKKELTEQVAKTISLLHEKESVVMNLFYLEELSIKEITEILGYSESNVKVLLHRARKNFKNVYEKL